jgi:Ca2+-binding RTX toxin-like protein
MANFVGTDGVDVFGGTSVADTARGNGGNDQLFGSGGNDTLGGGSGADQVAGGEGDDSVYSFDISPVFERPFFTDAFTAPVLDTGTDVDRLAGGNGNDLLFAGFGDRIDGGAGTDMLYISFLGAAAGVTADFRLASQTIGGGLITGIERIGWIEGSIFADTIRDADTDGNFAPIFGRGGDDLIYAGFYTGQIFGGDGNDTIDNSGGVYGFPLAGDAGDDSIIGGSGYERIDGGTGNDTLQGNYGFDSLSGGDGDDVLDGGSFDDSLAGDAGNDTLYGAGDTDYLNGGSGDDLLYGDFSPLTSANALSPSRNDDVLVGGSGADTLYGEIGNDELTSADAIEVGNVTLFEDTGTEHDALFGGEGDDAVAIGYGDDADGGNGLDRLYLALGGATAGVSLDTAALVAGTPFVLGGGTIQGIETLVDLKGSAFADVFIIATQATLLTVSGGDGNDSVISIASAIDFDGGLGNDRLISGSAADAFDGGAGIDTIDYRNAVAGISADLAAGTGNAGDTIANVENVDGSTLGDTLSGNDSVNAIGGRAGNDSLSGRGGDDTIEGGLGDDRIDGGAGVDTASYASATGIVRVSLALTGVQNTGAAGRDVLVDVENLLGTIYNDQLTGNDAANRLTGALGNDALKGGGGNDTLVGGGGIDQLTGGSGADLFLFNTAFGTGANDSIRDFASGEDRIGLSQTIFAALESNGAGGIDASNFTVGLKASTADHYLIYNTLSGQLFYDADGVGGAAQSIVATIAGALPLVATDFALVG